MRFGLVLVFGSFQFGASPERAADGDRWFARDKVEHLLVSAMIQSAGHTALRAGGLEYREASLAAGAVTVSAGLWKELWDRSQGRAFSWKDMGANAVGGGGAAVVIRQVDR